MSSRLILPTFNIGDGPKTYAKTKQSVCGTAQESGTPDESVRGTCIQPILITLNATCSNQQTYLAYADGSEEETCVQPVFEDKPRTKASTASSKTDSSHERCLYPSNPVQLVIWL